MERGMLGTVLLTFGGTIIGFVLSVFVFKTESPFIAGLLGTGGGTMVGAYIAAIAANEPLIGHGAMPASRPPRASSSTRDRTPENPDEPGRL